MGNDGMPARIALVGYRGSGKTSIGVALAHALGWRFIDTDAVVSEQEGGDIARIFRERGEAYFRTKESEALIASLTGTNVVIATGGGIVESPDNRALLHGKAFTVYLSASVETLLSRIDGTDRPPLTGLPMKDEVRTVVERRMPYYREAAHAVVDTGQGTIDDAVSAIQRIVEGR